VTQTAGPEACEANFIRLPGKKDRRVGLCLEKTLQMRALRRNLSAQEDFPSGGRTRRTQVDIMKRIILASAATLALMVGGQAIAQSVSIDLAPEHRTRIKEYVVKQKVSPYVVKERVRVGATLPPDVELREVPADWGPSVSKYRYIYSDDRVHFVDPSSRRVIYDLD
jgi:hypothetical protein